MHQAIIWTNDGRVYWRIYACVKLKLDVLSYWGLNKIIVILDDTFKAISLI